MSHLIPPSLDEADASLPLDAPRWYAVVTSLRAEKRAALSVMDALKHRDPYRDLAVYLPCETRWAKHAGKRVRVTKPLFQRYLFVCVRDEHIHLVLASDGVDDFVRSSSVPMCFGRRVVRELNMIRDLEDEGAFDSTREDDFGGAFKPEDQIEVSLGKFTGWPGRVLRMTAENRVKVLLSMFGKEHEKELDVSEVRAA